MTQLIGVFIVLLVAAFLFFQTRDVLSRQSGSGLVLLSGFVLLFIGERGFGEDNLRIVVSGFGLVTVLASIGLRYYAMTESTDARRESHQQALLWTSVSASSLLLYGLSLDPVTSALGMEEEAANRWTGVWWSLFPIVGTVGLVPTLLVDRLLGLHPVRMPSGAIKSLQLSGVSIALAVALMFPVNYLANENEVDYDVAYFRTTRAGDSTRALASTLTDPVEVLLFFPAGNEVSREVEPYFTQLAAVSEGRMTVRVVDQALDPVLAEELRIRDNGHVVFRQGEATEKFKLNVNIDRAKRELRTLDGTVQKHLIKLTRGQRTVYFLVGHGEANWREKDNNFRKINVYKREFLEGALGLKVKTFGVTDGSTSQVPDDADLVVVAAPTEPLLPEELETLKAWWDDGGSLFVMVDPEGDPLTDLLTHIGVRAGEGVLAHASAHAVLSRGPADYVFIATNKYGSHSSVKQLSRNSQVLHMVFATAREVTKLEETENKVTTLIRTVPGTWEDLNGNYRKDPEERTQVFELGAAITRPLESAEEGAREEARAMVIGDVGYLSDVFVASFAANRLFAQDSFKWLVHDEAITGDVESEEDVKIIHTREEDWLWFLAAVLAVPGLVLLVGALVIRSRQRRN